MTRKIIRQRRVLNLPLFLACWETIFMSCRILLVIFLYSDGINHFNDWESEMTEKVDEGTKN